MKPEQEDPTPGERRAALESILLVLSLVELLFNLVWVLVSLAMLSGWLSLGLRCRSRERWISGVAVVLLVVLLLPAISMTDDLMAASAPAETEHMLRPDGAVLSDVPGGAGLDMVVSVAMVTASVRIMSQERQGLPPIAIVLGRGFGRTAGVRPPPSNRTDAA